MFLHKSDGGIRVKFRDGDVANVRLANGEEGLVRIVGNSHNGRYPVQSLDSKGNLAGQTWMEGEHELLPTRKPGFNIRGLVFTTSANHHSEEGEIIATGEGPKNQAFYRVKFADGHAEWFSENDVFIETKEKEATK